MQLVFDAKLPFTDCNGNPAQCDLKIYKQEDNTPQTIVIATEGADNPGMSITNDYETVANFATGVFGLQPDRTLWVEHYNAESYAGKPLPHEKGDRYSLVHLHWDGQRFSNAYFVYLSESQLQGLLGSPLEQALQPTAFDSAQLTLEGVNTVAARFGLQVVSAEDERFQYEPTIRQTGKEYVVIDAQGNVLSSCKDLDSASMFLTLWSMTHAPLESVVELDPEQEAIALEQLNTIAAPKGLRVITSNTEGYRHHNWVVQYECRYALVNRWGTVLTTVKDMGVAETLVKLAADQDRTSGRLNLLHSHKAPQS